MKCCLLFIGVLLLIPLILSAQDEDDYNLDFSYEDLDMQDLDYSRGIQRRSADKNTKPEDKKKKPHIPKAKPKNFLYDLYPELASHKMTIVSGPGHSPCVRVGQVCDYHNKVCCKKMKCDCVTEIVSGLYLKCLCVDR